MAPYSQRLEPPEKAGRFNLEGTVEDVGFRSTRIRTHPCTYQGNIQVVFHEFGPHSLNILLYFFLRVPDWTAELAERQRIFLEILRLAEAQDVRFAFPTQTLHIESMPEEKPAAETPGPVPPEGAR